MSAARFLAALTAITLLPGCVGFHQKWLKAGEDSPPPHADLEGAWVGSWTSGHNGHSGKLRCIATEKAPGQYEFYYHATWAKVLSGGFRIECEVEEKDGKWTFSGDRDLGALGGEFSHKGEATPDKLDATFRSQRGDHGSFKLVRP
jgi:hypothetical protein